MEKNQPRLPTFFKETSAPLFIFDTHPIQYRAPVFKALHQILPGTKVYFFNSTFDSRKWWFREVGKTPEQKFNLDLTAGYSHETINTQTMGISEFHRFLNQKFKETTPHCVLTYGYYLPEHWILWWACRKNKIPLLFIGETFAYPSSWARAAVKRILQPLFFKWVTHCIAIGEKTFEFYRSLRISRSRISRARYCVDGSFFKLDSETAAKHVRSHQRAQLNIPESAFVVLFVGRLFERKRPFDMITLQERLKTNDNLYTLIVGNGPQEEELKAEAHKHPRIQLVGFQDQSQVKNCYYAADLLILPSEFETWGLVVNEAFHCGLPAIVTKDCGVSGDLVISGITGYVYQAGDLETLTSFVKNLMENPEKLKQFGKRAKEKVEAEYQVSQFAEVIACTVRAVMQTAP